MKEWQLCEAGAVLQMLLPGKITGMVKLSVSYQLANGEGPSTDASCTFHAEIYITMVMGST